MRYFAIYKYFKFLLNEFGFDITLKQRYGYTQIHYLNADFRVVVLALGDIHIFISDADSLGTCYDAIEYCDEFKTNGSYVKKAKLAAEWLKNKLKSSFTK